MKAKAVPEGTKTLEDERQENLEALDDPPQADEELEAVTHVPMEVLVKRTFKNSYYKTEREEIADETIAVRPFVVEAAEVSLSRGRTVNLGNFESVRVDVGIKVPCYLEEAVDAFEFAKRFTAERLEDEVNMVVKGQASKNRRGVKKEHPF